MPYIFIQEKINISKNILLRNIKYFWKNFWTLCTYFNGCLVGGNIMTAESILMSKLNVYFCGPWTKKKFYSQFDNAIFYTNGL